MFFIPARMFLTLMQPTFSQNWASMTKNSLSHLPKQIHASLSIHLILHVLWHVGYLKLVTDVQQLPHYMFIYKERGIKGGRRSNFLNEIKQCRYALICCFVKPAGRSDDSSVDTANEQTAHCSSQPRKGSREGTQMLIKNGVSQRSNKKRERYIVI